MDSRDIAAQDSQIRFFEHPGHAALTLSPRGLSLPTLACGASDRQRASATRVNAYQHATGSTGQGCDLDRVLAVSDFLDREGPLFLFSKPMSEYPTLFFVHDYRLALLFFVVFVFPHFRFVRSRDRSFVVMRGRSSPERIFAIIALSLSYGA